MNKLLLLAVQRAEVHAARRAEADGEHADAVGTDSRRSSALSHHWSNHICERDPMGH